MFLGLDVSSRATGVAFLEGTDVVESTCLRIKSKDSIKRAANQHYALDALVGRLKPSFAVIEGYAFLAKSAHKHMLYEAGTMIRFTLFVNQIPWMEINPSQLKKFATGNGRATKEEMIKAAGTLIGFKTEDDNIADAALLGYAGYCLARSSVDDLPLNDTQLELVTTWIPTYQKKVVDVKADLS